VGQNAETRTEALEAIALRRVPELTPAEKAAVEAVMADQLEINLGLAGGCCDSATEIIQVVIALTFAALCIKTALPEIHISEDEIRRLSPTATAIRLMEMRREALGHEH
jgi:hypothetical protein